MTLPSPFKCPGGKARLAESLISLMPERLPAYAEPFVGAGAVFRSLAADGRLEGASVTLSDAGWTVAQVWTELKLHGDPVQDQLNAMLSTYNALCDCPDAQRDFYNTERQNWNSGLHSASRQLFLRKTGYNGMWRENRSGGMNVPWGKYSTVGPVDLSNLIRALRELDVTVRESDFEPVMDSVPDGAVVYCDPPYHGTFSAYTAEGFTEDDHVRLIQACARLSERATVILSNAPTEFVLDHIRTSWPRSETFSVTATHSISCKVASRGDVKELAVVGGPRG